MCVGTPPGAGGQVDTSALRTVLYDIAGQLTQAGGYRVIAIRSTIEQLLRSSGQVDPWTLLGMRDAMIHRGPDDAGVFVAGNGRVGLAHRRLSIIDLSANGHQPMSNEDGSVWLVFQAESTIAGSGGWNG